MLACPSRNRIQKRCRATKITSAMKTRSKALVTIGRKPGRPLLFAIGSSATGLLLHRTEGEPGDDVPLHQAEEHDRRDEGDHRGGGELAPIGAGDGDELGEP